MHRIISPRTLWEKKNSNNQKAYANQNRLGSSMLYAISYPLLFKSINFSGCRAKGDFACSPISEYLTLGGSLA